MERKERFNITIPSRQKRNLQQIAEHKGLSMNKVILDAINDYIDRVNYTYSAPDLVLDRMNQILVSQMNLTQAVQKLIDNMEGDV